MAHEIWNRAENETGLILSSIPVMGRGYLLNVPKFVYEFALDNYTSEKRPKFATLKNEPDRYKFVPVDLPDYVLAIGSGEEMEICKKVTTSLTNEYTKDERIGKIRDKAEKIMKQAMPLLAITSAVLEEARGDS